MKQDEIAEALHINIYECNEATTVLQRLYIIILRVQWSKTNHAQNAQEQHVDDGQDDQDGISSFSS